MLKFLFFIWGTVAILYELFAYQNADKVSRLITTVKAGKFDDYPDQTKSNVAIYVLLQILYLFWVITGFFSSQWIIFLLIFCISFLKSWWYSVSYIKFDAVITVILLIFAMLNSWIFNINFFKEIVDFLGF